MAIAKSKATRIIGIDYGMSRIGIAASDEQKIIAAPVAIVHTHKKSQETIARLVQELEKHQQLYGYTIEEIVVGLPLMMSGKMGLLADEVKHFVELLRVALPVPIVFWDERLSSVQAERSMREGNISRKRRAQIVDTVAAVIILQNYLDHKNLSR